jgi:hypothetical protein
MNTLHTIPTFIKTKVFFIGVVILMVVGGLGVAAKAIQAQSQEYIVTQDTFCGRKRYQVGQVINQGDFVTLETCQSYLNSYRDFYQDNPNIGANFPMSDTTCGGHAQFACIQNINGSVRQICDDGFTTSEWGTCVVIGTTTDQNQAFFTCRQAGATVESCQGLAYGENYFFSEQQNWVADCVEAGGNERYCQAAYTSDVINPQTTGSSQVGSCIAVLEENNQLSNVEPGILEHSPDCRILEPLFTDQSKSESDSQRRSRWFNDEYKKCIRGCHDNNPTSVCQTAQACVDVASQLAQTNNRPTFETAQDSAVNSNRGNAPVAAVRIDQPVLAEVLINTNRIEEEARSLAALAECSAAVSQNTSDAIDQDDCARAIGVSGTSNLTGKQVADCLLNGQIASTTSCTRLQQSLGAANALTTAQRQNSLIADCMRAGAAEPDCRRVLNANPGLTLTGVQLSGCIQSPSTSSSCATVASLQDTPSYVTCSAAQLNTCINNRTCIYDHSRSTYRNVGAACGSAANSVGIGHAEITQVCSPDEDQFSTNGIAGAPCCGGGKQECGSSICSGAYGEKGLCVDTETVTSGSSVVNGSNGSSTSEATTGLATESRTDCSKTVGIVQNSENAGFTLKCDFDGNGSYGYHQPTVFIYGREASAACQVVCTDPTIDVESAARERYRQLQVTTDVSSSPALVTNANRSSEQATCPTGTFTSSFACVAVYKSPCIVESNGCFKQATTQEITQLCPAQHQQSVYRCSEIWGEGCARHPETGCYAPRTMIATVETEFADAIANSREEVKATAEANRNLIQPVLTYGSTLVGNIRDGFISFWGSLAGRVQGNNGPDAGEETENAILDTDSTTEQLAPETAEVTLLNNGRSINDGTTVMNGGEMQVESFCSGSGSQYNGITHDNTNWYCTRADGTRYTLTQGDFQSICRSTYSNAQNVEARNAVGNYNTWRCYGNQ